MDIQLSPTNGSSQFKLAWVQLTLLSAISLAPCAQAEPMSMGVPEVDGALNILETEHPAAMIARDALVSGLTKVVGEATENSGPQIKLSLADNYEVSADHHSWKFRIRKSGRFVNGEPIAASDVRFSLERCKTIGLTPWLKEVAVETDSRSGQEIVQLKVETAEESLLPKIPELVAKCPIVEESSSKLFGAELGAGTNLVGTGPYRVVESLKNRRIRLIKAADAINTPGPSEVEVRTFSDPGHGLTALRTGTLDALFTQDPDTLQKAKKDETLTLSKCSIYNVVLRRGLSLSCVGGLDFKSLRYVE